MRFVILKVDMNEICDIESRYEWDLWYWK